MTKLNEIKKENKEADDEGKYYIITRLHKGDLKELFNGNKKALKKIDKLTDDDMKYLCSKLADDYCSQLFWDSLKIIFEITHLGG